MRKMFLLMAAIVMLCLSGIAQANITIDTVAVGDAGNVAAITGYGSVGYDYRIGKYEVTAGQYAAFLNAVAQTGEHGLYNSYMAEVSFGGCNIQRTGTSGTYTYSIADDWANRPVNCVSYWDCCRFANWLGNGQGNGDTETGAYTLTTSGIANNTITRNARAKWAVTSEDEWYKAAYYKGGGTNAGYWLYPTCTNTPPNRDMADASGNNANIFLGSGAYPIDSGKYTTVAGEFQNSHSPYGTFDQGGNVREWNEAIISQSRGLRGGSYADTYHELQAYVRNDYPPTGTFGLFGFRVSQVPEPSSIIALACGLVGLLGMRRRRG